MTNDKDDIIKHLEMIQGIINRMAANSFVLKGWSVTAGAALLALAVQTKNYSFMALVLIPVVAFWALDAYYLHRERLYRRLFDAVRIGLEQTPSGSASSSGQVLAAPVTLSKPASASVSPFCMDTTPYRADVNSWWRCLGTPVVSGVHGTVALVTALIAYFWR